MTRALDRRLAKREAHSPTAGIDQWTARPSRRRALASRLVLEEALVLMKQADQLLATTDRDSL